MSVGDITPRTIEAYMARQSFRSAEDVASEFVDAFMDNDRKKFRGHVTALHGSFWKQEWEAGKSST